MQAANDTSIIPESQNKLSAWIYFNSSSKIKRLIDYNCTMMDGCEYDYIQEIYATTLQIINYEQLWNNLSIILYDDQHSTGLLVCENDDDQPEECQNGYCHVLTRFSSYANVDQLEISKTCEIYSNDSEQQPQLSISTTNSLSVMKYTCNKHMCNRQITVNQIRDILSSSLIVSMPESNTSTTTIYATTTTTVITPLSTIACLSCFQTLNLTEPSSAYITYCQFELAIK
ncbi:unnamed protein product, partial [Didymodactylos carnosus]